MANLPIDPTEAATRAGVRIRAMEPEDIPAMTAYMNEPSVYGGTMQLPYRSVARRSEWTPSKEDTILVAEDLATGMVVGNLGVHRGTNPRRAHVAGIGMMVAESHQGRGVGTALMAAACELADDWLQVTRLELEVYVDNAAGIALYAKFGFEVEGTLRRYVYRGGEFVDAHAMARLRD